MKLDFLQVEFSFVHVKLLDKIFYGYDYAENCYSQVNTLLKSLNKKILVFS